MVQVTQQRHMSHDLHKGEDEQVHVWCRSGWGIPISPIFALIHVIIKLSDEA